MQGASSLLPALLLSVLSVSAAPHNSTTKSCRHIPGDAGWPKQCQWDRLNATVHGRLIATVPLAHVCHKTGPFAAYDEQACDQLGANVLQAGPQTLCPAPGEIFNPFWANNTCSPFSSSTASCELGNRPVYSINVAGADDVRAGLAFAKKNNIRLIIKNTGIDYLGKSAGQGSLALWMYNLKGVNLTENYASKSYSGPAFTFGAGIIGGEASAAAKQAGYRIVAPECGLVGFTGGYVQGGGQSQLVTAYGLAADQVLEWVVVTLDGKLRTVTPDKHADLYWALAGGGGGTYGVVLSVTVKAFAEGPVAGGQMVVQTNDTAALWKAVEIWYHQSPSFVDSSRDNIQFFVTNNSLTILSFTMPDQNASSIGNMISAFTPELKNLGLTYNLTTQEYPSFAEAFEASYGPLPYGNLCPSFPIISSRLVPRTVVQNKTSNKKLVNTFRDIINSGTGGTWWIGCSILNVGGGPSSPRPPHPPNAVHPAWREAIAYCNPQTHKPYDWKHPEAISALRKELVGHIFPALEAATPGSGVLNEIDPTYNGDWKQSFYGTYYDKLLAIKHKYDSENIMYGLFAVGSDEFTIDGNGRLCHEKQH